MDSVYVISIFLLIGLYQNNRLFENGKFNTFRLHISFELWNCKIVWLNWRKLMHFHMSRCWFQTDLARLWIYASKLKSFVLVSAYMSRLVCVCSTYMCVIKPNEKPLFARWILCENFNTCNMCCCITSYINVLSNFIPHVCVVFHTEHMALCASIRRVFVCVLWKSQLIFKWI